MLRDNDMRILFDMWKHVSEKKILKRIESGYFWGLKVRNEKVLNGEPLYL